MKSFKNLCIISNDKFYKKKYTNHNDLNSIVDAFQKEYSIKIIGRNTKTKLKFLTIKNKIKFLDFFSIKTLKYIKALDKRTKFLFISLTPFNLVVYFFLKIFFNNFFLYLRSNGFKEYKIIFGSAGNFFYYLMLRVIINNVKLITSSKDLNFKNSLSYLVKPSELTSKWFRNIKKKQVNLNNVCLLYLGRYRKEKGIKDFIKLINSSDLNYQLKVYGLDYSNHHNDSKKIEYFPQISNVKKIIKVYDCCDIFILPSFTESAPKVIWESLARLRPVIIFKDIRHVAYKKKGVYICDRNISSLSKKINFIFKNYRKIQKTIKKNHFPLKSEFQKQFLNIVNKI